MPAKPTDFLAAAIRDAWQPPFRGEIWEFAGTLNLQAGYSVKGQFDINSAPWVKEPFEAIRDPNVRVVSIQAGVQCLKSFLEDVTIPYWILHDPGDCLFLLDTDPKALKYCSSRLMPLIRLPLGPLRKRLANEWEGVRGGNFAFWRADLERVDGFETSFVGWGLEDSDIVIRMIRAGVKRKDGRFATGVLHLCHPEADRSQQRQLGTALDHVSQHDRAETNRPQQQPQTAERLKGAQVGVLHRQEIRQAIVVDAVNLDVEVFGIDAEERIAHCATHYQRTKAGDAQIAHDGFELGRKGGVHSLPDYSARITPWVSWRSRFR